MEKSLLTSYPFQELGFKEFVAIPCSLSRISCSSFPSELLLFCIAKKVTKKAPGVFEADSSL